ncbi:SusC/RagA family TonB-linked outer membrane protein [Polaribacter porphyrae]|nr:TonB-dependent receptor [Polaribacter porphyrae]
MKIKVFMLSVFCMFCCGFAQSQTKINGTVSDKNEPLPAASVLIKGTSRGVVTDFDGNFEITASENETLVVSYLGYVAQEILIGNKTTFNIILKADSSTLDEIVVIGYGSVKRKDLTGSVVSLKAEDLDKVQNVSFEGALAAKASGVQVIASEGGPGAGFKVRVRGGTSINASNDPLYVIDGFAISGESESSSIGLGNSTTSPLASIDPSTIESIEVLKDASATAIYGSRGANGVIIITTKKGKKGRVDVNFETFTGFSVLSNKIDLLNAQEFVDWRYEYTPWDPNNPNDQFGRAFRDQFGNNVDLRDPRVILTDWQDEISRTAIIKNNKISITGGSDKSSYAASFSHLDQQGIIRTSNYERYNLNLRLDQNITENLKGGMNLNFGYNKRNGVVSAANENANGRAGIVTNSILFSPVQGLTRLPGAQYDDEGRLLALRDGDIVNPNRTLEENINRGKGSNVFGSVYLEYKIADGLKFKTSLRGNAYNNKGQAYFSGKFGWGQFTNGRIFTNFSQGSGVITEQNLNYNKSFGNHRLNITAVFEQQEGSFEFAALNATGFAIPGVNLDNLGTAAETLPTRSDFVKNTLRSYLARIQYDFSNRFTVNLSGRYDGSSRFAEENRWGFFPSAGVAWKISNEEFFKDVKFIDNAKIRASYGETGNNQIGSFRSLEATQLGAYVFGGSTFTSGLSINQLANPDLTWETTRQYDVGLNLAMFNNRVNLEIDYYSKETRDLLLEVPIPATSGFEFAFKNLGAVSNKGLEISINSTNIDTENFTWNSNFNISFNKNRVLNLGGANEFFTTAIGDNQITNDYIIRVGEALGSFYGVKTDGVYNYSDFVEFDGLTDAEAAAKIIQDGVAQNVPYYDVFYTLKNGTVTTQGVTQYRPGLPKFQNQNPGEDNIVNSEDRVILGNSQPIHFGGFTNNFTYKNFDLSILTSWSYGNEIYNKNRVRLGFQEVPFFNKGGFVRDRWTPTNPNTDVPGIWGNGDGGFTGLANSSYIEDGSFIRIANVTLGYRLSKSTLEVLGLKSLRIYGSIDNLYVFTNYSGYDPDVSVGRNQLTPGLDSDSYPRSRAFRIGLNVGL